MAIETKRGCGYRKVGGFYLVGKGKLMPCCILPIPLTTCPCCGHGVKQQLGFQWIDPRPFISKGACTNTRFSAFCPAAHPEKMGEKVGLLWVGRGFYPTVEDFMKEGMTQGFSKRIAAIPHKFEIGKTWVWLAHPTACAVTPTPDNPKGRASGVFYIWRPEAVEKVITETMSKDEEEMKLLKSRGITPFIVPDDDKDHQGSVYDRHPEPDLFEDAK